MSQNENSLLTPEGQLQHEITLRPTRNGFVVKVDFKAPTKRGDFANVLGVLPTLLQSLLPPPSEENDIDELVRRANAPEAVAGVDGMPVAPPDPEEQCGEWVFATLDDAVAFMGELLDFEFFTRNGLRELEADLLARDRQTTPGQ